MEMMISTYAEFAERLTNALRLQQPPVAICFAETRPKGLAGPGAKVAAGCRFWEDALSRTIATTAVDHSLCAIGVYTHGLETPEHYEEELRDVLKVFSDLGYVRAEDVPQIPALQHQAKYIIYSPLAAAPSLPDVVLLFVDARQTLILSEAVQQLEAQSAPAMGRPACAVVPQVMNTGRPAISLGCCGARAYLDVLTEEISLFAIPGAKLAAYTARVEAMAHANEVLSTFHDLRRRAVEAGETPTLQESLAAIAE